MDRPRRTHHHHDDSSEPLLTRRHFVFAGAAAAATLGYWSYATGGSSSAEESTRTASTTSTTTPASTTTPSTIPPAAAAAPTTTVRPLTHNLGQGMVGADVEAVQATLADRQFDPGPIDGIFGGATLRALWAFEKIVLGTPREDMRGIVTPDIWNRMNSEFRVAPRRTQAGRSRPEKGPASGPTRPGAGRLE